MYHRILRVLVTLALCAAVVAVAPTATAAPGDATLRGVVVDGATGAPFPAASNWSLAVDLFRVSDGKRVVGFFPADGVGAYELPSVPPGDYRLRFRVFEGAAGSALTITRYQWYSSAGPVASYDLAETITFAPDEVKTIDEALDPIAPGGALEIGVIDVTTSSPPAPDACLWVTVFEESGIGIGLVRGFGEGSPVSIGTLPDGGYKVVVFQRYDDPAAGCPDPGPAYLDQWYGGVRGSGFLPTNDAFFTDTPYFDSGTVVDVAGGDTAIEVPIQPTPRCGGRPPTIIGTSLDDTIDGTAGDDIIVALGGDDTVRGLGGDDTICAGGGADVVSGGPGDDRIYGNAGADDLRGNAGRDVIRGGRGKDLIRGGRGHDELHGNRGNDTIYGGWGADVAWGGPGTDRCRALVTYGCE